MSLRLAALALAALALGGCETTQEKSAKLERAAKAHEGSGGASAHGLAIARVSSVLKATQSSVVHSSEGTAVAVTVRNDSARAQSAVPIEIEVLDAHGAQLYANTAAGLAASLTRIAVVPAHAQVEWVDDQVQAAGQPASVRVKLGEGTPVRRASPRLSVLGAHASESGGAPGAEGTLVNASGASQSEVVVSAVARRGGRVVAAGRAVQAQVPAHSSTHFQLFFVGSAAGAQLSFGALANSAG